jgi:sulfur-oxidizing protein SoxY
MLPEWAPHERVWIGFPSDPVAWSEPFAMHWPVDAIVAENGAVVPVGATSNIPNTTEIFLIVEKNPTPLAAGFEIPAGTEASVQTRLKMGQSTDVIAVVKADGKLFMAKKETKVTLGGCGG